jgi:hypothetical protein
MAYADDMLHDTQQEQHPDIVMRLYVRSRTRAMGKEQKEQLPPNYSNVPAPRKSERCRDSDEPRTKRAVHKYTKDSTLCLLKRSQSVHFLKFDWIRIFTERAIFHVEANIAFSRLRQWSFVSCGVRTPPFRRMREGAA